MLQLNDAVDKILPELHAFRHDLHAHPELAYQEQRTSAKVLDVLKTLPGLEIRNGMAGGTGIIATLNADKDGPCVLLRADMDALPIMEMTELPYKSRHEGVMHACGHDGHTTCLIGAARVLCAMADQLPGKVKFCFQPAEENGAGGERMIEDGALDNPRVDAAFALHGWPDLEVGQVVASPGPMLASATPFEIVFEGRGGHAAYPHKSTDVITAAAQLISSAQQIRTRFIDPIAPIVLSFTQVSAGDTHNVMPERCLVKGTIRSLDGTAHAAAQHLLQKFMQNIASSFEIQAELRFVEAYPVLINDADCTALIIDVARNVVGKEKVLDQYPPSMGGEDFAFYAQRIPAAMFRIGLRQHGAFEHPGLHNPRFNFTDEAVPVGVRMHCAIAHHFLTTRAR